MTPDPFVGTEAEAPAVSAPAHNLEPRQHHDALTHTCRFCGARAYACRHVEARTTAEGTRLTCFAAAAPQTAPICPACYSAARARGEVVRTLNDFAAGA